MLDAGYWMLVKSLHPASSIQHPASMPLFAQLDFLHPGWQAVVIGVHALVEVGIAIRVVMRRRPTGETLAWIMVVFTLPFIGFLLYLMLGELRLGRRRERRIIELNKPILRWLAAIPERSQADRLNLGE